MQEIGSDVALKKLQKYFQTVSMAQNRSKSWFGLLKTFNLIISTYERRLVEHYNLFNPFVVLKGKSSLSLFLVNFNNMVSSKYHRSVLRFGKMCYKPLT